MERSLSMAFLRYIQSALIDLDFDLDLLTCDLCQDVMALVVPVHGFFTVFTFTFQWVCMVVKFTLWSVTKVFVFEIKNFRGKFSSLNFICGKFELRVENLPELLWNLFLESIFFNWIWFVLDQVELMSRQFDGQIH